LLSRPLILTKLIRGDNFLSPASQAPFMCLQIIPQARLRLARGYTLAPADVGFAARVAQVANLRYKHTNANCLVIAIDD
jgi:hypothetical protein